MTTFTEKKVNRHELKFYISRADYMQAKAVLEPLMERDPYQSNDDGYWIRSLYFDDIHDSSMYDKLAGVEHRDKYRLRIYDPVQEWAKLERKRKVGDYVQKSSVTVTRDEAEQIAQGNYDVLLHYNTQAARSIFLDLRSQYYRPVVIVDYIRDAYVLDYNDIRITFDKRLRGQTEQLDLFDPKTQTIPQIADEYTIMEIKFNDFLPPWFTTLMQLPSATQSAISKYCISRIGGQEYSIIEDTYE